MIRFKTQAKGGPIYTMILDNTESWTQMTPHGNIDIGPVKQLSPATRELLILAYRENPNWTECY